jgi:hypothetical protein
LLKGFSSNVCKFGANIRIFGLPFGGLRIGRVFKFFFGFERVN